MLKRFSRNPRAECVYLAGTMTGWRSTLLIIIVIIACHCFDYQHHHLHQILVSTFNLFIWSDVRWWVNLPGRVTGCASWRCSSSSSSSSSCSSSSSSSSSSSPSSSLSRWSTPQPTTSSPPPCLTEPLAGWTRSTSASVDNASRLGAITSWVQKRVLVRFVSFSRVFLQILINSNRTDTCGVWANIPSFSVIVIIIIITAIIRNILILIPTIIHIQTPVECVRATTPAAGERTATTTKPTMATTLS